MSADSSGEPETFSGKVVDAPSGDAVPEPLSFGEVFDAATPPGTDKAALLAALKAAQVTGGQLPGNRAPDISGPASAVPDVFKRAFPALGSAPERQPMCVDEQACCVCGDPRVVYHNYRDQPFCAPCADGEPSRSAPPAGPEDPFTQADASDIALGAMYDGMIRGGIPKDSVERIIGHMLADMGPREQGSGPERG